MANELPHCDEIWRRYFSRWYRQEDLASRIHDATRPDAERLFRPGTAADEVTRLTADGVARVAHQLESMLQAVRQDWPTYLEIREPIDIGWIAAFDSYWTRALVRDVLSRSDVEDFGNDLVVLSCEFGVALAEVMLKACPQLDWCYDWPYWESALLDVPSGYAINVFDWGIKRFSEYGIDDGFAAKTERVLELVRNSWRGLE